MEANTQTNSRSPTLLDQLYDVNNQRRYVNPECRDFVRVYQQSIELKKPRPHIPLAFFPLLEGHFPLQYRSWMEDVEASSPNFISKLTEILKWSAKPYYPKPSDGAKAVKVGFMEHRFDHIWTLKVAERCKVILLQDSNNLNRFYFLRYFENYGSGITSLYNIALHDYTSRWISIPDVASQYNSNWLL